MRRLVTLHSAQQGHTTLRELWLEIKPMLFAGHGLQVEVRDMKRTSEQNARMWAMLTDVATQVVWYGRKLTPDDWKCIFTAALKQQDVVPGLNGGFVVVGAYTSRMTKKEHGELMDLIESFGAQNGVKFSAKE